MAYEQKSNDGVLFPNHEMREGKQDPDWRGSARIKITCAQDVIEDNGDGTVSVTADFWISSWGKVSKEGGKKFRSLGFSQKAVVKTQPPVTQTRAPSTPPPPSDNDGWDTEVE